MDKLELCAKSVSDDVVGVTAYVTQLLRSLLRMRNGLLRVRKL